MRSKSGFIIPKGCKAGPQNAPPNPFAKPPTQYPVECSVEYHGFERSPDGSRSLVCSAGCGRVAAQDPDEPAPITADEYERLVRLARLHSQEAAGTTWRHEPVFGNDILDGPGKRGSLA